GCDASCVKLCLAVANLGRSLPVTFARHRGTARTAAITAPTTQTTTRISTRTLAWPPWCKLLPKWNELQATGIAMRNSAPLTMKLAALTTAPDVIADVVL